MSRTGDKGLRLEELLRAYFLKAGFFVVRGVPFQHDGDDLTDIDLWLYEQPTGSSRRRQIVDAKSKTKPKAVERLLWTRGLMQLLDVDGAYVATTDSRPMLRTISRKLGVAVLDGADIRRISESDQALLEDRITEDVLFVHIASVDKQRRNKNIQLQYQDLKCALIDNFGAGTINRALDAFAHFANTAVTAHPGTEATAVALRLSYFAAAVVAISLDYVGSSVFFRATEERFAALVNAIRYGNIDESEGLQRMRLATALVQKYSPSGDSTARTLELAIKRDLANIPAEIIAEFVVRRTRLEELIKIAKGLEHLAMSKALTAFDALGVDEKAFVAALLDFTGVDRARFASCWVSSGKQRLRMTQNVSASLETKNDGPLFSPKDHDPNKEQP
jgi:hypothetical protein